MASGNWLLYGNALENILNGTIDIDTDSFRIVLVTSSYTPNQNTDAAWSTISANEVAAGGGYSTHGQAITLSLSRTNNVVTVDGGNTTWTTATITAKYAVIVRDADSNAALAAGDIPLFYIDLNTSGSVSTTSGSFTIEIDASGLHTFTAATS